MLIEFRVRNYRSFYQPQVLSMVAAKDTSLQKSNCMESGITVAPKLLRSAVLYGPNACGKSNLIAALAVMRDLVATSTVGIREGQALPVTPFRLFPEAIDEPTEFEITFIEGGVRYQYGFALTEKRIMHEWLLADTGHKAQRWFERAYDSKANKEEWYLGSYLLGGKQRQLWQDSTRANALFLSTAVNLNSSQLRPIFNWFVNKLVILAGNALSPPVSTLDRMSNEVEKARIIEFLQAADLGIMDVKVEKRSLSAQQMISRFEAGRLVEQTFKEMEQPVTTITSFHHDKNNAAVAFNFITDESQGTKRLFDYAGPILDALQHGRILVVDELDNSLHPKMVRFLMSLIHNPELNKNKAQFIFSTHDTSLLDTDLFRRDQIWFIEKDTEQASKLYPLTDFSPRKDEALEKGYLMGRYGALPFFGELKF